MSIGQKQLREVEAAIRKDLSDQIFQGAIELIGTISEENKPRLRYQMDSYATTQTMSISQEMILKKAKELKVIS